jgi:acetolactate synthase regulatory subunit
MSNENERMEVVAEEDGQRGFRVPAKLLERFLEATREMGLEFTVDSDSPEMKIVRLNSEADHARVAVTVATFNANHVGI